LKVTTHVGLGKVDRIDTSIPDEGGYKNKIKGKPRTRVAGFYNCVDAKACPLKKLQLSLGISTLSFFFVCQFKFSDILLAQ